MRGLRLLETAPARSEHLLDRMLADVRTGRFEQTLAALTAAGAAITAAEISTEHDSASFGNKSLQFAMNRGSAAPASSTARSPILMAPSILIVGSVVSVHVAPETRDRQSSTAS